MIIRLSLTQRLKRRGILPMCIKEREDMFHSVDLILKSIHQNFIVPLASLATIDSKSLALGSLGTDEGNGPK